MSIYKYGDFECAIDATDVDFIKNYEDAISMYSSKIDCISPDAKTFEVLEYVCGVFYGVFEAVFGKNAVNKMFAGKRSVNMCMEAFKLLVSHISGEI